MRIRTPWALTFTTRITLIFGVLGVLAILVASVYAARTSQAQLNAEISNTLDQRHRVIQSLIENRLNILNTYLDVGSFNHTFASLVADNADIITFTNDENLMFHDSASAVMLDLFFLLSPDGSLLFDGGMPLYNSDYIINKLDSPILYTSNWRQVGLGRRIALIRATPIFDPSTIQLKGYMVAGLAIGQNRYFIQHLLRSADVDQITLSTNDGDLLVMATRSEGTEHIAELHFSDLDGSNSHYLQRPLTVFNQTTDLKVSIHLSPDRFMSQTAHFVRSFLLLSGIFLGLLIFAAWLLHLSHSHAIARLLNFIDQTQKGVRGVKFEGTGIAEYNQVGRAMQHMVDDLNIAATVFESGEGMIVADNEGIILQVNPAFTRITGYEATEVTKKPLTSIKIKDDKVDFNTINKALLKQGTWQDEIWSKRKSGERFLQWTSISAVFNGQNKSITNYVVTLLDVTERKEAEIRIRQLAFYDQLTMLPNRQLLMERLEYAIERSQRNHKLGAILYIDLDDFKTLNDTRGHHVGDQLLKQVGERLSSCLRRIDTVARLGGDEFIILLEEMGEDYDQAGIYVEQLCHKILYRLSKPYYFDTLEHFSTLSIGIAMFIGKGEGIDELLKQADLAMYQAKATGRNTYRFFDPTMQVKVTDHANLARELRLCVQQEGFHLVYQPQVDAMGQLFGAEVLLRWQHPEKGFISPVEFIPVAEDTGLIIPIGDWVIEQSCQQLAKWHENEATRDLILAVNISPKQFQQDDFVDKLLESIHKYHFDPATLKLEITESMLLDDVNETVAKISTLKEHKISFSLDDFGTGYSSLSYLKRLPLDQLKIDKSFVTDMSQDKHHADIAKTIVSLAKSMELSVIAEGVETEEQLNMLESFGCYAFQGYYFSRPLTLNDFTQRYL